MHIRALGQAIAATSLIALAGRTAAPAHAATARIKDIVNIEGVRDNQLVGYGLVVGLNGTGDSLNNSPFTKQSLQAMLERLGVNTRGENMRTGNVAAVMVTANLPAFSTQGSRLDVSVASLGDATSLQGGTLLVTPLLGADGEVYAIAQGSVTINGFKAQGDAATVISGVPTTGRIASGGLIEREIDFTLGAQRTLRLALKNPDLTTSRRIALSINDFIGTPCATPEDPATVRITLPQQFQRQHRRPVDRHRAAGGRDRPAGQDRHRRELRHHRHGQGRARLDRRGGAVQPHRHHRREPAGVAAGAAEPTATTTVVPRTDLNVDIVNSDLAVVHESVSLQELVDGLNALGISPRDLIAILQAIKASGALQADIEVL